MKLNINITERDKKLLVFLSLLIIGVLFYFFAISPFYSSLSKERAKNSELTARYNELKGFENDLETNKEKYDKQKIEYMEISKQIPTNLTEKYVLSDMYKISNLVSADAQNYTFSPRIDKGNLINGVLDESKKDQVKGVYAYSAGVVWNIGYDNFKKFIELSKTYESVFIMDNISMAPKEDGKLSVSFTAGFIGYDDEKAPLRVWENLNIQNGKSSIFSIPRGGSSVPTSGKPNNNITSITSNPNVASIDKNKDFVVVTNTINSPTSSIVIEKSGLGKSVFGTNKDFENGVINIKGSSGSYMYNMSTENEKFPNSGYQDFKTAGSDIVVVVYSSERKGSEDRNIVNLKINNESDKKVYVYIVGDDKKLPRCSITKGGKNVYVEKR